MNDVGPILAVMKIELEKVARSLAQMQKTHVQVLKEEWITGRQVMSLLGISNRTLEYLKSSGKLPYSKIKGLLFFKVSDIEQLLQQHYVNPLLTSKNKSDE